MATNQDKLAKISLVIANGLLNVIVPVVIIVTHGGVLVSGSVHNYRARSSGGAVVAAQQWHILQC